MHFQVSNSYKIHLGISAMAVNRHTNLDFSFN